MADEIRVEIEALKETGKKYIALLEIASEVVREFNTLSGLCGEIAAQRKLDTVDYFTGNHDFITKLKGTLESEYEVFDKGIDSFIKADEELSKQITGFIESEMKTNEKYKKRLEGKEYEERAKEIAKILEDILGKYEYINENGETVVYNHIEARNLYSEDEFKMHNKVIIKRIEMEDGQYVDMFIDEDTGEEFKRISHVLGPNQQQVKYGMEKNRIYVDLECYSDDTPWEGFKSWGFSAINCLIQDKYDMQLFACFVLSYIDPETSTEIVKSIEIRKEETEKYYRSKSRSQELFNDMQTGYRAVEICGMLMSVSKLVEELPELLARGKKHIVNAINFLDECFESVGDIIKESKKVEIPSMDDIVAWFNRATGNGGLQPAIDGVPGSIVDDIDEVKKPQVDKIDGGDGTKWVAEANWLVGKDGKVNWKSKPNFGHTFETHGQGAKNTRSLMDRAKTPNKIGELTPQGQWLDNQKVAEFLNDYGQIPYNTPPIEIDLPEGMGQVILPSGEIVPATKVRVVINRKTGKIRSAIPIR